MKYGFTTIKVREMEESIKFYTEILNLKEAVRFSPQQGVNIAFLKDEDENKIELIELEFEKNKPVDTNLGRVSVGFVVNSLDEIITMIKERNIEILRGPIEVPNGEKFLYIKDPNGVEIEFIEGFLL